MKLQKAFFLVLGLAFLVSIGSLVSGGSNQKAQTIFSTSREDINIRENTGREATVDGSRDLAEGLVITPDSGSQFLAGSQINSTCTFGTTGRIPDQMVLVGATINPYVVVGTYNSGDWGENSSSEISGSFSIPSTYGGRFDVQCVAYIDGQTYNISNEYEVISGISNGDTQAPTAPQKLGAGNITSSSITISWAPSTDNVGVSRYHIYRNNGGNTAVDNTNPIASVSGDETVFVNNGLLSNKKYTYRVRAMDSSENLSGWATASGSTATNIKPITLTVAPPTGVGVAEVTTSSVKISWTASPASNIFDYAIYANNGGSTAINTTVPVGVVQSGQPMTFTHQNLNPSTQYKYRVAARDNANNRSSLTTAVNGTTSAVTVPPPSTPSISSVVTGSTTTNPAHSSLVVSWIPSANIGYKVYRSNTSNGTYSQVSPSSLITTGSFVDSGLNPSSTYFYKLQACYTSTPTNCSAQSSVVSGSTTSVPDTTAPTVPAGLQVSSTTANSISLSWTASTDVGGSVAGYNVFRSTTSTGTYTQVGGNITTTTFIDTGLGQSTTRFYKVRAFDNAPTPNYSAQSSAVSGTTLSVPSAPTGVSVTSPTTSSLTVSWNAVSGATSYKVYRMTSSTGGVDSTIPAVTVNQPNINTVINGLSSGTTYFFSVSAVNSVGESTRSSTVSGATSSPQVTLSSIELTRPDGTFLQTLSTSGVNTVNVGFQNGGLGSNISVRVKTNTNDSDTGSVVFNLNGTNVATENTPPYMMFGDNNAWPNIAQGPQTILITPYSGDSAGWASRCFSDSYFKYS
ncbi:MAG: fibronectin type III domain-containing protein [Candidatus Paceibacterota bacterium]